MCPPNSLGSALLRPCSWPFGVAMLVSTGLHGWGLVRDEGDYWAFRAEI